MKKFLLSCGILFGALNQDVSAQLTALCNNNAQPICAQQGLTFASPTGQPSLGTINCLFTTPNPNWFYMQVGQSGNIDMTLTQTNLNGGGIDVDFMLWGPFNSVAEGCTSIGNNVAAFNHDCSYSASATEFVNINNGVTGQFYILLITNFSGQAGTINLNQTGGNGTTNCGVLSNAQNNGPICLGEQLTLTANGGSASGSYSFAWYLMPDFTTPLANTQNVSIVPPAVGIYDIAVIVTDNFSLESDTSYTQAVVNAIPPAPTFDITSPACQGTTVTMVPNPALPVGTIYSWTSVGGYVNNTSSVTFNNAQPFFNDTYTLQVTINGCQSPPFSQTLTVFPTTVPIISGPTEVCEGALVPLEVTNGNLFNNFVWNGVTGTNPQFLTAGTYTVEVTDLNGCVTTSAPYTVTLIPNPLEITGPDAFCEGSPITLIATPGKQSYTWSTGSTVDSTEVSQDGLVIVSVVSTEGCNRSDSLYVKMYDKPEAAFSPAKICDGDPVSFQNETLLSDVYGSNQTTWFWSFDHLENDSITPATSDLENPGHVFPTHGTYNVIFEVTSNFGCKDTIVFPFLVIERPTPQFYYESLCFGEVAFFNTSEQGTYPFETVTWDFGDGVGTSNSMDSLVYYTYAQVSTYNVTISITDTSGCPSSQVASIQLNDTPTFDDLPNIITPNGDGVNDDFTFPAILDDCYNYTFTIFNRWGGKVFQTTSSNNGFEGISNLGSKLNDGVFFWTLTGNGTGAGQETKVVKKGTITVAGTK
ncbi:MAG: PKD domain-containing protein [Flavobacteriales bacterium]|nr:PKD domain-containing protein [Flavobacteriales bacterium]